MARLVDADALYNGAMKDEYFKFVERDNHGRESFAYSCAMQRLVEAPTIDAIPVDWMIQHMNETASGAGLNVELNNALFMVGVEWERFKKEQEAS